MHDIKTLELTDSITPELRNYVAAMRDGFFESPATDEGLRHWLEVINKDQTRLRAIYDKDRPFGMADQPVATFASWDATINTGRGMAKTNMITDVTVQATHRRQGLMAALMTKDLEEAQAQDCVFSALTATDARIYSRFGFGVSATARKLEIDTGDRFVMVTEPTGSVVWADPTETVKVRREIFEKFHSEQFWSVERPHAYWNVGYDWSEMDTVVERAAVHLDEDGNPDGVMVFRVKDDHIWIRDLLGLDISAELELLRILGHAEGHHKAIWPRCFNRRHPLTWALQDHRVIQTASEYDTVWVRIMDVKRALEMRQFDNDGGVTITIDDPMDVVSGTYRVDVSDGQASVEAADGEPDATMELASLAALYSGLAHPGELAAAGTIQGTREGLDKVGHLFTKDRPGIAAVVF